MSHYYDENNIIHLTCTRVLGLTAGFLSIPLYHELRFFLRRSWNVSEFLLRLFLVIFALTDVVGVGVLLSTAKDKQYYFYHNIRKLFWSIFHSTLVCEYKEWAVERRPATSINKTTRFKYISYMNDKPK